jgi:hypothetical protein
MEQIQKSFKKSETFLNRILSNTYKVMVNAAIKLPEFPRGKASWKVIKKIQNPKLLILLPKTLYKVLKIIIMVIVCFLKIRLC